MGRYEMGGDAGTMALGQPTADSLFELGMIYSAGREVVADLVAAHKWFNLAYAKGKREAAAYREEIAREMSSLEIADAQRSAREWLKTH